MPSIVPTITEEASNDYRQYLDEVSKFAKRVHVDISDGIFSSRRLVGVDQIKLSPNIQTDLHIMLQRPQEVLESLLTVRAFTTIIHVESECSTLEILTAIHEAGLRAGIALLPQSRVQDFVREIENADHVLIFAGELGYQGGEADLEHIAKIASVKQVNPRAEIAWDGGINDINVVRLLRAGVHVLNVGGYIKYAKNRQDAYVKLDKIVNPDNFL